MFRFSIYSVDNDEIQNMISEAKYKTKVFGLLSFESMKDIFNWTSYNSDVPINNPSSARWGRREILDIGFKVELADLYHTDYTIITLPNPMFWKELSFTELGEKISDAFDPVKAPSHYVEGRKYEPRKVIHDWGLNFNLGNAVKYISRAGRKDDPIEDLRKAIEYIEFEIDELEGGSK